jgi:hypothetical protein
MRFAWSWWPTTGRNHATGLWSAPQTTTPAPLGQPYDHIVGIGDAMRVDNDHTDIVEWHATDLGAIGADGEETAIRRKVAAVLCNLDHTADHRGLGGPGSCTRPKRSTVILRAFRAFICPKPEGEEQPAERIVGRLVALLEIPGL